MHVVKLRAIDKIIPTRVRPGTERDGAAATTAGYLSLTCASAILILYQSRIQIQIKVASASGICAPRHGAQVWSPQRENGRTLIVVEGEVAFPARIIGTYPGAIKPRRCY